MLLLPRLDEALESKPLPGLRLGKERGGARGKVDNWATYCSNTVHRSLQYRAGGAWMEADLQLPETLRGLV